MKRKKHDIFELVEQGEFDFEIWLELNDLKLSKSAKAKMGKAVELVKKHPATTPTLDLNTLAAGLELAEVLTHFNADFDTLTAAILLPSFIAKSINIRQIRETVDKPVSELVDGSGQMEAIRNLQQKAGASQDSGQVESLRKMLLGMVDDARVVLLKLADRVISLRHIKKSPRQLQRVFAAETQDIFAPLANRLGIGQLKWELEDLSFRYLEPELYKKIAKSLKEKRVNREHYIQSVIELLDQKLEQQSIAGEVSGRVKHIYSIWKKMSRKQLPFEEIYDVRAVRILVDRVQDCYAVLGIVHGEWQHIPKEFDDYIATPKENGYSSIHTAVLGPEGKVLEVQIRTFAMHEEAEKGIAAHWAYKEGASTQAAGVDAKIDWMRQLLEWQSELADTQSDQLMEEFKSSVADDRVFVFTPAGKVVDLPSGSTPIDFAYRIHSSVGHRCVGAKVAGRIVPLTYKVQSGDVIEVMTKSEEAPSRDWLVPYNGYIGAPRTRGKINQWFNRLNKEDNAQAGRLLLEKELSREGVSFDEHRLLASKLHLASDVELFAKIGTGDLSLLQVVNRIKELTRVKSPRTDITPQIKKKTKRKSLSDISVAGVGDLLTHIAKCCKPVPGESIIGYITKGRGVMIHSTQCSHSKRALRDNPERVIEVQWEEDSANHYTVDVKIVGFNRKGLLKDITTVLANEGASITDMVSHKSGEQMNVMLEVELAKVDDYQKISRLIKQLPNIYSVERRRG